MFPARTFVIAGLLTSFPCAAQLMDQGRLVTANGFHRIVAGLVAEEIHDTVQLGDQRLRFLLDTGAPLCISQEVQQAHHYPVVQEAQLTDANAQHRATTVVLVDSLRWGGMLFCGVPAVVLDLAHSPLAKDHVQGLLGSNVLRHLLVRFDAMHQEILFTTDPARVNWDATRASSGQLDPQDDLLMPLAIGTCFTDTVQFDCGMRDLYVMQRSIADEHADRCPGRDLGTTRGHGRRSEGMLGKRHGAGPIRLRAKNLRLGSTDLGATDITTTEGPSRIGRELLSLGTLTINYPEARYIFTLNAP